MFTVALFRITPNWKQQENEETNYLALTTGAKLWSSCTMEYYSATKGNELLIPISIKTDLENHYAS